MPQHDLLPPDQRAVIARLLGDPEPIPEADKARPVRLSPEQREVLDRLADDK